MNGTFRLKFSEDVSYLRTALNTCSSIGRVFAKSGLMCPLYGIVCVLFRTHLIIDASYFSSYKWPQWNKVYHRWITNNFQCKWHTSTTSGSKSSPTEIFHRTSSGARTPTWNSPWTTKEKTSTRNCGVERTSLRTAKATPTTRERATEEQETRISEALWLFYSVEKPRFRCRYIDQSLQSFSSVLRPEV